MLLSGEYRNTIDEKGRLLIPSKLRNALVGNVLIVTRGVERCLWLMAPDEWKKLSEKIMGGTWALFDSQTRLLQRRIVAPAQECEIDRSGRILLPATLRDPVGIGYKQESVLLGIHTYLELWNCDEFESYIQESEKEFEQASQALSKTLYQIDNK